MTTQTLTFDELRNFIDTIETPAGQLGIFRVKIQNKGKHYDFHCLKQTGTYNDNLCGFSLNHYGWLNLPMPKYKESRFHNSEDVCIDVERLDFASATRCGKRLEIYARTFKATVTWP